MRALVGSAWLSFVAMSAFAGFSVGCSDDSASGDDGADMQPEWGIETRPTGQTCVPPATTGAQAPLLSASGCVDPADPKKAAATLMPYGVASPLWSDGAEKHRYLALPDEATVHVRNCTDTPSECDAPEDGGTGQDDGDWDVPVGTVLMKTFALEGRLIETRLLMRKGNFDWWGFSYRWRDDQSDADLLASNTDGYDAEVEGPAGIQTWHFPSRQQCLQCHTTAAGVSLGLDTSQLNTEFRYPNGVAANQLATLAHAGVFDRTPEPRPAYADPAAADLGLEERARSYLHANCSLCHRPGSNYTGIDLRHTTSLGDSHLCDAPDKGDLGVAGALRLVPGEPESSVVSLRMHSLETSGDGAFLYRMPQIGSNVVDELGTSLIDEWIASLTACR
jgi:uncharacterized repeat protein (TIGR03806 family)